MGTTLKCISNITFQIIQWYTSHANQPVWKSRIVTFLIPSLPMRNVTPERGHSFFSLKIMLKFLKQKIMYGNLLEFIICILAKLLVKNWKSFNFSKISVSIKIELKIIDEKYITDCNSDKYSCKVQLIF